MAHAKAEIQWVIVELNMPNGWRVAAGRVRAELQSEGSILIEVFMAVPEKPEAPVIADRNEAYPLNVVAAIHMTDAATACAIAKTTAPITVMWMQHITKPVQVPPLVSMMSGQPNTELPAPDFRPVTEIEKEWQCDTCFRVFDIGPENPPREEHSDFFHYSLDGNDKRCCGKIHRKLGA
jgi:hypothetical protein